MTIKKDALERLEEQVILVNEDDEVLGSAGKLAAHETGALHRALSVFVFNAAGDLLLQKRAADKYHSAGLWSNTCCSHPRPGEPTVQAAHRRLREEMGFDCPLNEAFSLYYKVQLGDLYEHEYDHVFLGQFDGAPAPNAAEVADLRWASAARVAQELATVPETFTAWFHLAFFPAVTCWSHWRGLSIPASLQDKARQRRLPEPASATRYEHFQIKQIAKSLTF